MPDALCLGAEKTVADALDHAKYAVEVVPLGEQMGRTGEAETAGANQFLPYC